MVTSVPVRVRNLRKTAAEMRRHAGETDLPVYVELMLRTARQLDEEALKLERDGPYAGLRTPDDERIRYIPPHH